MVKERLPKELFEGLDDDDITERVARIGRFLILEEMGYFGEQSNIILALADDEGSWVAQVRRRFSNTYGDVAGCHLADLEVAAEMLGVFDDVYNVEALKNDGA